LQSRFPAIPQNAVSCGTFFAGEITIELAEQGITVLLCPVRQVRDEVLNLLAGGIAQSFGAAEVDGIGLDQDGIQLVMTNDLAEVVANAGTIASSVRSR
jgi:hypothetical protein